MYLKNKKVYGVTPVLERHGKCVYTPGDCEICGSFNSFRFKVTFDKDWDETENFDICGDCLIVDGWYKDIDELKCLLGIN